MGRADAVLASRGFRCIAHDRRGHGRSSQPWDGNDLDRYADDLSQLLEALAVEDAIVVGHSTGGGEVTRYIGRHGTRRVAKVILVSAIPPLMLKTDANPGGLPIEVFDGIRADLLRDRGEFYRELSAPFYGANRPGSNVSQGVKDMFWAWSMQAGKDGLVFGLILPCAGEVVRRAVCRVRYGDQLMQVLVGGKSGQLGNVLLVQRADGLAAMQQRAVGVVVQRGDAANLFGAVLACVLRAVAAKGRAVGIIGGRIAGGGLIGGIGCAVKRGALGSYAGVPEDADEPAVGVAASPVPGWAERAEKCGRSSSSSIPLMTPSVLEGLRVVGLGGVGGTNLP